MIRSTDMDRTLMSAEAQLSALYRPIGKQVDRDESVYYGLLSKWQYVTISHCTLYSIPYGCQNYLLQCCLRLMVNSTKYMLKIFKRSLVIA